MGITSVAYAIWECDARGCDNVQSIPANERPEVGIEIYLDLITPDGKETFRSGFAHSMECAKELVLTLLTTP